jgi:hypothetical protein
VWQKLITDHYKKFWEELIAYFSWYDTGHFKNNASSNYSSVACEFVTAVTFLPSLCLATTGGFLLSRCLVTVGGILPSRCLVTVRGFLPSRCVVTVGRNLPSRCLVTIRGFLPSSCLTTIGGIRRHTHGQKHNLVSLLFVFQNKESRLKKINVTRISNTVMFTDVLGDVSDRIA